MTQFNTIDPLNLNESEYGTVLRQSRRRELSNIIKSYVSPYDVFSEAIQNALDAIDRRRMLLEGNGVKNYKGMISIHIDLDKDEITITDNGTGFEALEFKAFVAPNMSFHKGNDHGTRGNKGVGASYLAFGFDYFCVNTISSTFAYCGELNKGRSWVDGNDDDDSPKIISCAPLEKQNITDTGTSILIRVGGANTKPKTMKYFSANTPKEWGHLLKAKTPLGAVGEPPANTTCTISVVKNGAVSIEEIELGYTYPHKFINSPLDLDDFLQWQSEAVKKNHDATNIPAKYKKRSGIYKNYDEKELLDLGGGWSSEEADLIRLHSVNAYAIFMHSTDVWDFINDKQMGLRKGLRILRGGLLIANNGMIQGEYLVIPLTSTIGYQKQCHVVVHLTNADPDLGRKGFQPEVRQLCEEISKRIVNNSLKRFRHLLKPNTQTDGEDEKEKKLAEWIREQEEFQKKFPLTLTNKHFFKPKNEISIVSIPQKEQDVIALFNQLIAGGVIRSINLLATSQTMQYDGVYRYVISSDEGTYAFDGDSNPLGLEPEKLKNFESQPKVLEYKHNLDYLIQDFHNEEKRADDVNLAICWEMGSLWKEDFECTSYLLDDNISHRNYHGLTHQLNSATSRIDVVVLSELIQYLEDYEGSQTWQKARYENND